MALIGEFGAAARDADPNVEPDEFRFYGHSFGVAQEVGAMPLLRFAAIADAGTQADELAGLAAMYELLRDCLVPEPVEVATGRMVEVEGQMVAEMRTLHGWPKFQKVAADNKVDADELMRVCGAVYQAITGRPTRRPSASADGSPETTESSREPSFSEASSPLGNVPPIQMDPRVRALQSVSEAGAALAG